MTTIQNFYDMSNQEREQFIENIKTSIKESDNPLYRKMERIIQRTMNNYQTDFYVHDMEYLSHFPKDFIWIVRESGTHFLPMEVPEEKIHLTEEGEWNYKLDFEAILKTTRIEKVYRYSHKKNTLIKVSLEKADEIVHAYADVYESKHSHTL